MMEIASTPWPLLKIAIEPKSEADEEKLRFALSSLADEDIGFRFTWDEEAGQTIVFGNAELQLDLIIHRLVNEFEVALNISAPDVAYRETITRKHEQDYTHKKQSHGMEQFARVKLLSSRMGTIRSSCLCRGFPLARFAMSMPPASKKECAVSWSPAPLPVLR